MDNKTKVNSKKSQKSKQKKLKISGVIVLTIAVICIVFFAAKSIFSSNNSEIPMGIGTETINTDTTTTQKTTKKATENNEKDKKTTAKSKAKTTERDESKADESSDNTETNGEKAYVTQYANLHTEPSKDSENIVCMSPNVEVDVLEKLDNGYWKIYFMNVDGPHTGYLWNGYLKSSPTE